MRRTASEKLELIRLVEESDLSVRQTLREMGICRSTFYEWYARYLEDGIDGLAPRKRRRARQRNAVPERVREAVVQLALEQSELSPRELACRYTDNERYFVSESTVYRILKAHDLITSPASVLLRASESFKHPTRRVHELWQTDFTHLQVVDWGWYYLSTVMDDFSRFIIAWMLSSTMGTTDVENTLDLALQRTGVSQVHVHHRPRLLSDNGPAYVSAELRRYLNSIGMAHTRGAPYHPMTQGKIERWHRSMKNVIQLEHYYSPAELEAAIGHFVDYYNHERYHESLNNVTPADVYYARQRHVLTKRAKIKRLTMQLRRKENQAAGAA